MTRKTYPAPSLMEMRRVTTHPGEILDEEFLKPLNMSGRALAKKIGVPPNRITQIVSGDRDVTADTAIRLSRYFGTSPEFWLNLQIAFDLTEQVVADRKEYQKIKAHELQAA